MEVISTSAPALLGRGIPKACLDAERMMRLGWFWSIALVLLWLISGATLVVQIGLFTFLVAFIISRQWRNLTHPFTWFPGVLLLYSLAYPALMVIGLYPVDSHSYKILPLHAVALLAFVAGAGDRVVSVPTRVWGGRPTRLTEHTALLLGIVLIPVTALQLVEVLRLGLAGKVAMHAAKSTSLLLRMDVVFLWLSLYLSVVLFARWSRAQSAGLVLTLGMAWFALSYLVLGERDLIFRFLLVALLAGWEIRRQISAGTVYLAGAAGLLLLPATQAFKGALAGFSYAAVQFDLWSILGGEFRTAAQNLHTILQSDLEPFRGQTFLWDLRRVFSSSLLGTASSQSTTEWFNAVFFPYQRSGRGFSLVAEGYLNFGAAGVAAVFLLLGVVSGWMYRRRFVSVVWYGAYLMFVPLTMYVQRADLANLMSLSLKTIVLPACGLWLVRHFLSVCAEEHAHSLA